MAQGERDPELEAEVKARGGKPRGSRSSELWMACPMEHTHAGGKDSNPSWSYNVETNVHSCFSCHYKGNGHELRKDFGMPPKIEKKCQSQNTNHIKKISTKSPEECMRQKVVHRGEDLPLSTIYRYLSPDGEFIGAVARYQNGTKDKTFRPYFDYDENGDLKEGHGVHAGKMPLYHLEEVVNEPEVWIAEGEKACDLLRERLRVKATCSVGGCGNAKNSDWSWLKNAQTITIWPDNDPGGADYAREVAQILSDLTEAEIRIVRDVASWLPLHGDVEQWAGVSVIEVPTEVVRPRPRRVIMTDEELDSQDIPPREYLMLPAIKSPSLTLLHAQRGVGKTRVAMALAYCCSQGIEWVRGAPWKATRPWRVLYIDGELPMDDLQSYYRQTKRCFPSRIPNTRFDFLSADRMMYERQCMLPDLASDEGCDEWKKLCEGYDLVVFDNLSCLCRSGKENEAESFGPTRRFLIWLRFSGSSALVIHHQGKEKGKQRGSSSKEDIMDTILSLEQDESVDAETGTKFDLKITKKRHCHGKDAQDRTYEIKYDATGLPFWYSEMADRVVTEAMREMVNRGMETGSIRRAIKRDFDRDVSASRIIKMRDREAEKNNPIDV